MDLHRGPGLRHQEARPPTGSTPPTGGEPGDAARIAFQLLQQEASLAMRRETPSTLLHTEDRPVPRQQDANRAMRRGSPFMSQADTALSSGGENPPRRGIPPTGPKPANAARNAAQTTPYRGEARYASGHPSNSYCSRRRFNRAVTHPSTTAGRDDLTPLLCNIWSPTIRSLPA